MLTFNYLFTNPVRNKQALSSRLFAGKSGQANLASSPASIASVQFGGNAAKPLNVAAYIDHTKLTYKEGEVPTDAIRAVCTEAKQHQFFAVCVRPDMIATAKSELANSGVQVATVIGFPTGKSKLADQQAFPTIGDVLLSDKMIEAQKAIQDGADELDLVLNVRQFLGEANQPEPVATINEFKKIKSIAGNKILKVILETDLLTPEQIKIATQACVKAGVDIVKTSTGMVDGGVGATVPNVELIHQTLVEAGVADKIGIKASGGIKTAEAAKALIEAGVTRLGTSQGVAIAQGMQGQGGY